MTATTKHCGGCGRDLPPAAFSRDRTARDGLQRRCKGCKSIQHAAWWERRGEARYREHCARKREYMRARRAAATART